MRTGQEVKRGDGLSGWHNGPLDRAHLFFGVRWHNARINPQFLLENPAEIPAVDPHGRQARLPLRATERRSGRPVVTAEQVSNFADVWPRGKGDV